MPLQGPAAAAPPAAASRARQDAAVYRTQLHTLLVHNSQAAQETRQVSRLFNTDTREAPGSAWSANKPTTSPLPKASATQPSLKAVHGLGPTTALVRATSELGFPRRGIAQRCRPIEVRGRLPELRC